MTVINFDAAAASDGMDFSPVPPGTYKAAVKDSEAKPTKDGRGKRLLLKFLILEGEHKGRTVTEAYNYENPSTTAQNIARSQLKEMTIAIFGEPKVIRDSTEWHMKPLLIDVWVEPGKDGYDPKNAIKGYSPVASPKAMAAAPSTTTIDNDEMPNW